MAIDRHSFEAGASSDAGYLAKTALLETLSAQLRDRLPTLLEPTPQEIRKALGGFASGDRFAALARDFFARLTYRSLDLGLRGRGPDPGVAVLAKQVLMIERVEPAAAQLFRGTTDGWRRSRQRWSGNGSRRGR